MSTGYELKNLFVDKIFLQCDADKNDTFEFTKNSQGYQATWYTVMKILTVFWSHHEQVFGLAAQFFLNHSLCKEDFPN